MIEDHDNYKVEINGKCFKQLIELQVGLSVMAIKLSNGGITTTDASSIFEDGSQLLSNLINHTEPVMTKYNAQQKALNVLEHARTLELEPANRF